MFRRPLYSLPLEADRGFTLIEVVAVLTLTGILAAVAVPKYFDIQEEAARKACLTNQATVERAALEQWLAGRLNGADDSTTTSRAALRELIASLSKGGKLCPDGGVIDVVAVTDADTSDLEGGLGESVAFKASCSQGHGSHAENGDPEIVAANDAMDFMKWLLSSEVYGVGQGKYALDGSKTVTRIDQFFTKYNTNGFIDSEADFEGAKFNLEGYTYKDLNGNEVASVTAMVKAALEQSGLDTDGLIWRLERTQCASIDYLRDENGDYVRVPDKNGELHRIGTQYSTELVLTVAQKPSDPSNAYDGQAVGKAYQYTARVTYGKKNFENENGTWTDKSNGADNVIENITINNAPKEVNDLTYEVRKDQSEVGNTYLALKTR